MKTCFFLSAIIFSALSTNADELWAICPENYGIAIEEIFWNSDVDKGNGPDYHLKSGQIFRSIGNTCQKGSTLTPSDWIKVLNNKISSRKTVTSFKVIKSFEELKKFLEELNVIIDEPNRLKEAVDAYLAGKPLIPNHPHYSTPARLTPNSAILVGTSSKEAVIALVNSDGKERHAKIMVLIRK